MYLKNKPCYLVGEIGINANGDLSVAKKLISAAKEAGFDAVKFQKRTIEDVYTDAELQKVRGTPFGGTNGDLKRALEFDFDAYSEIALHCTQVGIDWTASPWDENSVDFLMKFDVPYIKVASASVTDAGLLESVIETGKPIFISTGMCDLSLIRRIVSFIERKATVGQLGCLYHCTSTYPASLKELNLLGIDTLQKAFPSIPVGYSGHEVGVAPSVMAAVLGARSIERHITLNRTMFGSDQAASLEPQGFTRLARDVRVWEQAKGNGSVVVYDSEIPIAKKLRRKDTVV